jgi:hypothetical protein
MTSPTWRPLASLLVVLVAGSGWLGCTKETAPPVSNEDPGAGGPPPGVPRAGGGTGGTVGDGGLFLDGGDGGMCTLLSVASAAPVMQQQVAEAAPIPLGGVIPDGTYVLSKDTIYTGPGGTTGLTGVTSQQMQVFSAMSVGIAVQPPAPNPAYDESGTYTSVGVTNDAGITTATAITFSFTCPLAGTGTLSYSVNGTTLLEFLSANEVLTFIPQP